MKRSDMKPTHGGARRRDQPCRNIKWRNTNGKLKYILILKDPCLIQMCFYVEFTTSGNTLHFYCENIVLLLQTMLHFDCRRIAVLSRQYLANISLVSRHYLGFILFLSQKYLAFILVSLQFCNYTAIRVQSYCI